MGLTAAIVSFFLGLLLIVKGGDLFVDAAVGTARITRVPAFVVGATIVSLATTLPELLVSLFAAGQGRVELAAGNAVGSVTANTGLILSLAMLALPGPAPRREYLPKSLLLLAAVGCLWFFSAGGVLSWAGCGVLLALFGLFLAENLYSARRGRGAAKEEAPAPQGGLRRCLLLFALGAASIVAGAQLLVNSGTALAAFMGVPESVVAVTLVAVGTSLPELVTTLTAILKKQASLSAGNVIGANIIDTTLILPLCCLLGGQQLPLGWQCLAIDLPLCLLILAAALLPTLFTRRFSRWQGFACLGLYVWYMALLVF